MDEKDLLGSFRVELEDGSLAAVAPDLPAGIDLMAAAFARLGGTFILKDGEGKIVAQIGGLGE
jgi:hypothetical protein